ncbi:MAG TPA: hypothetical protein VJ824_05540 [Bacillota bacterium]|nr:hypothetical protein [Bacillota bacterium]
MEYTLALSSQQLDFLLETIQAFVDNKKLIHLPDKEGEIITLPLTEEALLYIQSRFNGVEGKKEFKISVHELENQNVQVEIVIDQASWSYKANLTEFDIH